MTKLKGKFIGLSVKVVFEPGDARSGYQRGYVGTVQFADAIVVFKSDQFPKHQPALNEANAALAFLRDGCWAKLVDDERPGL
jgi:hypothetical protein